MKQQTEWFIEIVDAILQHHSGFEVKMLKVEFNLHKNYSVYIDGWISFAIRSKARVIVLDFRPMCFPTKEEPYVFPCHLFTAEQQPCIEYLRLNVCSFKPSLQFSGFDSLKTLDLCHVDITDDGIQILLSNCCCLEYLRLEKCDELVNLTASHALCSLHHLVMRDCGSLSKIDLDVINLSYFEFNGYMMDINFRAASRLVDAWIGIHRPVNVFDLLSDIAIASPQLGTLTLHLGSAQNEMLPTTSPADLNTFMHLEHLDLRVLLWEDMFRKMFWA